MLFDRGTLLDSTSRLSNVLCFLTGRIMRNIVFAILVAAFIVGASAPAIAQCRPGSNCQHKCDATWQTSGYQSAAQCYGVWAIVNSHGPSFAAAKENANRALNWKKAPGYRLGINVDKEGHVVRKKRIQ
jgi:hypothetical protein